MTKLEERTSAKIDAFAKHHEELNTMYGDFNTNINNCKGEETLSPAPAKKALKGKFTYGGRRRGDALC